MVLVAHVQICVDQDGDSCRHACSGEGHCPCDLPSNKNTLNQKINVILAPLSKSMIHERQFHSTLWSDNLFGFLCATQLIFHIRKSLYCQKCVRLIPVIWYFLYVVLVHDRGKLRNCSTELICKCYKYYGRLTEWFLQASWRISTMFYVPHLQWQKEQQPDDFVNNA
jgi:hypothetical protein